MVTKSPVRLRSYNSSSEYFDEEKQKDVENKISIKERTFNMKVKSSRVYDVKIAPGRKTQVGNHFVPKLSLGRRKPRRICIEVMKPSLHSINASQDRSGFGADNDDGCDNVRSDFMLQLLSGNKPNTSAIECALNPDEIALMRIYKPEESKILRRMNQSGRSMRSFHSYDSDLNSIDKTISTIGLHGVQENDEHRSWFESFCYSMDEIRILSRIKNIIEVQLLREKEKLNRTFIFQTANESRSFFELVVNYQKNKNTLLQGQSEQSLEEHNDNYIYDDFAIIMEVCSAWDLNIHPDDLPNMSIACVVMNNRGIVHETKGLSNTAEPNWSTRSGSLCLLTISSEEIKSSSFTFEIIAKRQAENDVLLGTASIYI